MGNIYMLESGNITMFSLSDFQGKGIAQRTIKMVEKMFPQAASWVLAKILEEERNCYLCEKMGYSMTGIRKKLNEQTTLVFHPKITGPFNQI